jgi:hypothetical protein
VTNAGPRRDTSHPGAVARVPNSPPDLAFCEWGGEDLNLRPTDYESAAKRFDNLRKWLKALLRPFYRLP